MKLSFTTLACPNWDLDQIIGAAKQYGYDAIDFRHYKGSTALPTLPEFTTGLAETAKKIAAAGLKVSGLSSGIHVFNADAAKREQAVNEAVAFVKIAAGLGAPLVRVFGGKLGTTPRPEALKAGGAALRAMADAAAREGVVIGLETHDDWVRGAEVMGIIHAANAGPSAGVLWDFLNSCQDANEPPEVTWHHIKGHLVGTHWKDSSSLHPAPTHYCLPGHGRAPFRQIHHLIHGSGYAGYYTFEWEKAWHPELAEADVSLPAFVQTMRAIEAGN